MRGDVVPPNTAPVCLGARVSSGCARAPGPEAVIGVKINYVIVDKTHCPTNLPGRNNKAQRGTDK